MKKLSLAIVCNLFVAATFAQTETANKPSNDSKSIPSVNIVDEGSKSGNGTKTTVIKENDIQIVDEGSRSESKMNSGDSKPAKQKSAKKRKAEAKAKTKNQPANNNEKPKE
jgi:hypothetical protein